MFVWLDVPIFKYVIGLFSNLTNFFRFNEGKSLGNLNLTSNPYSEIVVFADLPMVARVVNSNFSPDLNTFLLIKDDSNAIPISSILECLRSSPNLNEYFFFGYQIYIGF